MSNEEKQIEEIDDLTSVIWEANHKKSVLDYHWLAIEVYKAGYCKASDVAREIFEEIEELLNLQTKIACETRDKHKETFEPNLSFLAMLDGRIYSLRVVEEHIAELKKKYIGEDTNITTNTEEGK